MVNNKIEHLQQKKTFVMTQSPCFYEHFRRRDAKIPKGRNSHLITYFILWLILTTPNNSSLTEDFFLSLKFLTFFSSELIFYT